MNIEMCATISMSCGNRKWKMEIPDPRGRLSMDLVYMVEKSERSNKNCRRSSDLQKKLTDADVVDADTAKSVLQ